MKKMNNKGFAVSTMLYGLLIVIVLVMGMIISIMAFNRKNSKEFTQTVVDELEKNIAITAPVTVKNSSSIKRNYESINDAIADAPEGSKIIVQSDITETNTINIGKNIAEINLGGKKINGCILIDVDSKVKISNGSIDCNDTTHALNNKGNLTLENVNINLKKEGTTATALYNASGSTLTSSGGSVTSSGFGVVNRSTNKIELNRMVITATAQNRNAVMVDIENSGIDLLRCTINGTIYAPYESSRIYGYNTLVYGSRSGYIIRINRVTDGHYIVALHGYDSIDVYFPTWTEAKGQDDIQWYRGILTTDSYSTFKKADIYASNHNGETGSYITHFYLDLDGNGNVDKKIDERTWSYS